MRAAALALAALALTAGESSQDENAKLENVAKREARHRSQAERGLSIARESTKVRVLETSLVKDSEGAAAVVRLRNVSATTLQDVPIEITVRSASGTPTYTNDIPGLAAELVAAPLLPARGELAWVEDQVPASGDPRSVSAKVGEGEATGGAIPRLSVQGTTLSTESSGEAHAEGSVVNHSPLEQHEVAVYAVARRAGRIVAAGSAVLPQAAAGAATHFQLYFIGDPRGAQLQFSAVAGAA